MAIDIRAIVSCSLGDVISASIGDSSIGNGGLITTSGSCVIDGIVTPAPGQIVTFSYTKAGQTLNIPRKLRVLNSYADPFRRITEVELGCKLTYLADLEEYESLNSLSDPSNSGLTQADTEIVIAPINAAYVLDQCLNKLGITNGGSLLPSFSFSQSEFEFNKPYVDIISDLLVSECLCGYLDFNENFIVFNLNQEGGSGPVLTQDNIIDVAPVQTTVAPADTVIVRYSTLKLKREVSSGTGTGGTSTDNLTAGGGTITSLYGWTKDTSIGPVEEYTISWFDSFTKQKQEQVFSGVSTAETTSEYTPISVYKARTRSGKIIREYRKLLTRKITTTKEPYAKVAGNYLTARANATNMTPVGGNRSIITDRTVTEYQYDNYGNQIRETTTKYKPFDLVALSVDLPLVFYYTENDSDVVDYPSYLVTTERTTVIDTKFANKTKTVTVSYLAKYLTKAGQKAVAEAKDTFTSTSQVENYARSLVHLVYAGQSTRIFESSEEINSQSLPTQDEIILSQSSDGGGSGTVSWKTEQEAEIAIAVNGSLLGRRVELSMPYAPDDRFFKSGSSYGSTASQSEAAAINYGRAQSKLITGAAYGTQIQVSADAVPGIPFSPIIVNANGLSAFYRADGLNWSVSKDGVLCSFTALFYGAVGGTGDFWFPVADGITTLPEIPPIIDGQITVPNTVPTGNETLSFKSPLKTKLTARSFNYPLQVDRGSVSVSLRTKFSAEKYVSVAVPMSTVSLTVLDPTISISAYVAPGCTNIDVLPLAPIIRAFTGRVSMVTAAIVVTVKVPTVIAYNGRIEVGITKQISITGPVPVLRTGLPFVEPNVVTISADIKTVDITAGAAVGIQQTIEVTSNLNGVQIFSGAAILPGALSITSNFGVGTTTGYHQIVSSAAVLLPAVTVITATASVPTAIEFQPYYSDYVIQNYSYDENVYTEWWGN